jgi:hypothetical protein
VDAVVAVWNTSSPYEAVYVSGSSTADSTFTTNPGTVSFGAGVATILAAKDTAASSLPWSGYIAFAALWKIALDPTRDIPQLKYFSPRKVRPDNLVSYTRFTGASPTPDLCSATPWTVVGTQTKTDNPPVFFP